MTGRCHPLKLRLSWVLLCLSSVTIVQGFSSVMPLVAFRRCGGCRHGHWPSFAETVDSNSENDDNQPKPKASSFKRRRRDNSTKKKRKSFFFSMELLAPPLEPISSNDNLDQDGHDTADDYCQPLPITYTNDPVVVQQWVETHVWSPMGTTTDRRNKKTVILGLDMEAVPQFRRHTHEALRQVALVQISTPSHALVVQLCKATGRPSRACERILKQIVESNHIIKAGCALDEDLMDLANLWWRSDVNLQAPNRLDLGCVAATFATTSTDDDDVGHYQVSGLKRIAAKVLGLKLCKSRRIATSNWGQVPLAINQVMYAARDAWVAAAAVDRLSKLEPDVFGSDALQERLQTQEMPLRHLMWRREKRQTTKQVIRNVRQMSKEGLLNPNHARGYVEKLKQVLERLPPIHPEQFPFLETGRVATPATRHRSFNLTYSS